MLGISWQNIVKYLMTALVITGLALGLTSCGQSGAPTIPGIPKAPSRLSEVAPPAALLELRKVLDVHQPQVSILAPRSDEVLQDTSVAVRLRVNDLPLFQDEELGLGPHLHFILDNQPYEAIYDVSEPILLQDLTPGTHTIRIFASRPWHESFKNDGAYAQTTFHIFAKTPDNNPSAAQPLLTYSRPKGNYGAEPVMLDFYLSNAPLHLVAQESAEDEIVDWQIRATINGESFTFDRWEPIYLKGLQSGRNWVQLELLDEQGNPYANAFNNTVRLIDYQPGGTDTLSKLTRGELSAMDAMKIVDPNYVPPPEPEPEPEPTPEAETETLPEPALEPGDIPEVLPDTLPDEPIIAPPELVPPPIESPQVAPPAPEPPQVPEEPAAVDRLPENVPFAVPESIEPAPALELPQEVKVKEQLTEEVEEQLEQLESSLTGKPGTVEAPIAPADPLLEPDDSGKLFGRAKRFLNQVLPRPDGTESIDSPAASPSPAPTLDAPAVDSPEDAVVIEETPDSL